MGERQSRQAGRGNHSTVLLRDIKPPKLKSLVGVRVEQSEQADYKNT